VPLVSAAVLQELSVWTQTARDDLQQKQLPGSNSTALAEDGHSATVADDVGHAAQRIVTAFQAVKDVLEGVGSIRVQLQSLQVSWPGEWHQLLLGKQLAIQAPF
jgi:hypothetical protein